MSIALAILWLIGGLAFLFVTLVYVVTILKFITFKISVSEFKEEWKSNSEDEGSRVLLKTAIWFIIALTVVSSM